MPENIQHDLDVLPDISMDNKKVRYVGIRPRSWAYSIDSVSCLIIFFVAFKFFGPIKLAELDISSVPIIEDYLYKVSIFLVIFYFTLPECWGKMQASPGKYLMGMKVVNSYGEKIGIVRSLVRNILKALSGLFILPFITAAFPPKKRAMHDIFAGTYVIYRE